MGRENGGGGGGSEVKGWEERARRGEGEREGGREGEGGRCVSSCTLQKEILGSRNIRGWLQLQSHYV